MGGGAIMDIREIRLKKGMTQSELARKVGVSLTTIANWENKTSTPSDTNMKKLKQVLEVR